MKSADYKKLKVDNYAVTRDIVNFDEQTGNIYKSVVVLSKRANQIASELKEEFHERSQEFVSSTDNLEEYNENIGQIELAKYFEQLPKPTLLAVHEYQNKDIYFRDPEEDRFND
ncbi:MAG: DNA-directed RNA polymerase subunit omega [Bacteroidales bacterium]|nr:DNA-directed RNA polymerase subunit omega [Bacteroidales bacterium]